MKGSGNGSNLPGPEDGVLDDVGILVTHPEMVQNIPSTTSELIASLEEHKLAVWAIGGTACATLGAIAGGITFSRIRRRKQHFRFA